LNKRPKITGRGRQQTGPDGR